MTNLQSLSVFVTERLTLAAQEIFKAVEVTVTEYHEEISRSRQENELLKRRLLEAGIDFYTELPPGLSGLHDEGEAMAGLPGCGEQWAQQSEEIQVKLELSAAQEESQDSQPQLTMDKSISPKLCLQNEQQMEEMIHPQTSESSMDTLLHAGPYMQIKEEPSEPMHDLRSEAFFQSQTSISADPSTAIASSHTSGLEDELDSHRLSSMHKAVRSKTPRRGRPSATPPLLKRRTVSRPPPEIRFGPGHHWPQLTDAKNANRCHDSACTRKTKYICMECLVALCPGCFAHFHTI